MVNIRILQPKRKNLAPEIKSNVQAGIVDPNKISTLLLPGEMGVMLDWKVWDTKTGKVLEEHTQKSESFVQQFLQLLFINMIGLPLANAFNVKDTANVNRTPYFGQINAPAACIFDVLESAAGTNYGIRVGIDTGGPHAPTISDYQLITPIVHGAGGGQMQYGAVTFGLPGSDATTSQLTVTRNFTANAGGITVMEIALYCRAYDTAARYFCIIRDVIAGGITVPAGQTLTINYRPQAVI